MLSVAEALAHVLAVAEPLPGASSPLDAALGRVLAEEVVCDRDSPPWDKSVFDGFAVRAADVAAAGAELRVIEEITAGSTPTCALSAGTTARIMTGAPLPAGADTVIMVERTQPCERGVRIETTAAAGHGVLARGASMRQGEAILNAGATLRPIEIGLLAEVGRTAVTVHPAPRVAILATGDELVPVSETPAGAQIRNSNGPLLGALVASAGGVPRDLGIARDTRDALAAKIEQGLSAADVLVLAGGVSAGILDLVPSTLQACGVREVFHKVQLKPGKPVWFGVRERSADARRPQLVFGLPGNPVSTLVCFGLFVRPALLRLAGRSEPAAAQPAILTHDHIQRDVRPTYFPAVLIAVPGQPASLTPLAWKGSGDLRTLACASALAYFPGGERTYRAGETVDAYLL